MRDKYILDDAGNPVSCDDLVTWGAFMEKRGARIVAKTEHANAEVIISTVFLGLDHRFGGDGAKPILWETMIFGGPHSDYQERYTSRADAVAGHERALAIASGEIKP